MGGQLSVADLVLFDLVRLPSMPADVLTIACFHQSKVWPGGSTPTCQPAAIRQHCAALPLCLLLPSVELHQGIFACAPASTTCYTLPPLPATTWHGFRLALIPVVPPLFVCVVM